MEDQAVTFQAIFSKAATTVDGGMRVTFDLDENWGPIIEDLAKLRGKILHIAIIPEE